MSCELYTPRDLRCATGTPPHVVQAITRHADIDVTMTISTHTDLEAIEWEDL